MPNNKAFAFLQTEYPWLRLLPVRWVVLLMLAPAGIWAAAKWGNRDALFILLVYASLYSAANVAFFICDRYRYPVWPVMAAIAGGGLLAFVETIRRRRWRGALCLAAGMALMASISLPNWFGAKLPSFARDYLFRSIAWYEKGHFPEALSDIDRSLALDPGDVTALHHRGNVLLALNRLEEAAAGVRADIENQFRGCRGMEQLRSRAGRTGPDERGAPGVSSRHGMQAAQQKRLSRIGVPANQIGPPR